MDGAALYPKLLQAHVACVMASGTLFAARGAGVLAGARWPMAAAVRFSSYAIDTALLAAALSLLAVLGLNPFVTPWLGTKLVLLVVYMVLGSLALKRARGRGARAACLVAAVACFAYMASVAVAHDPRGLFS